MLNRLSIIVEAIQNANDSIVILNKKGIITWANEVYYDIMRQSKKEFMEIRLNVSTM